MTLKDITNIQTEVAKPDDGQSVVANLKKIEGSRFALPILMPCMHVCMSELNDFT